MLLMVLISGSVVLGNLCTPRYVSNTNFSESVGVSPERPMSDENLNIELSNVFCCPLSAAVDVGEIARGPDSDADDDDADADDDDDDDGEDDVDAVE